MKKPISPVVGVLVLLGGLGACCVTSFFGGQQGSTSSSPSQVAAPEPPPSTSAAVADSDSYSRALDIKYQAQVDALKRAVQQSFGEGRVAADDFGYNAKLPAIFAEYTAQQAGERLPTQHQIEANLATFFRLVEESGLPWKFLTFTAYGYGTATKGSDRVLLSAFWRHDRLGHLDLTTANGKTLLQNASEPTIIDPSIKD